MRSNRQAGYTVVEVMVGMTVGLIVAGVFGTVVVYGSSQRHDTERIGKQLEAGRSAMQILSDDIANTGDWGEFDPREVSAPTTKPDPCSVAVADIKVAISVHIQAYAATATMPACIGDVRSGTPVLVVRRASTCTAGAAGCDSVTAGEIYFQASLCSLELASGPAASHYVVAALPVSAGSPFLLTARNCATPAVLRRVVTHIYFVANNNAVGDGVPTLKRAVLKSGTFIIEPLVDGIENVQYDYVLDTNGDSAPDAMTPDPSTFAGCAADACTVTNWTNVVAIRIRLLARTTDTSPGYLDTKTYALGQQLDGSQLVVGPFNDGYRRRVYMTTVRLNDPAGRRE